MINLLPAEIKREIRFARLNIVLVRYLWLSAGLVVILAVIIVGGGLYLHANQRAAEASLASTQRSAKALVSFEATAKITSERLAAIKTIQAGQTRFSLLLSDLSLVLPQGTSLTGITLTGDDKKPVRIAVKADSYNQALVFRNALATSPRIAAVDLESITKTERGYDTNVVLAFKTGAAK